MNAKDDSTAGAAKEARDTAARRPPAKGEVAPTDQDQALADAGEAQARQVVETGVALADDARAALSGAAAPRPLSAPEPAFVDELNNIDFRKMIGGPLQAVVDAQTASAMATVDFITKVGFDSSDASKPRQLVMVDFTHSRAEVNPDGTAGTPKTVAIKVPLLAMLPVPSLRIEHVVIDFNVKLNSVQSSKTSDALGVAATVGGGFGPVNFKVSASYQRKTATSVEIKKEYSLNVNVKAVQDEMPAGLERLLNLLAA